VRLRVRHLDHTDGLDGLAVPVWMQVTAWMLGASILPFCAVAPVLLLRSGYTYLRRAAGAGIPWTLARFAVASASLAVEALFLIRFVHWLRTPYGPNLGHVSWRALDCDHPFWPEVDAEQRERIGNPPGENSQP
jgi:hypothetical protein